MINNGNINGPILPKMEIVLDETPVAVSKKKSANAKPEKTPKAAAKKK